MTLNVTLSADMAKRLAVAAQATSQSPEQVAVAAIERNLTAWERAEASLAPIRAAFEASGLTEDEAGEFFEAEKRAWREERRAADER